MQPLSLMRLKKIEEPLEVLRYYKPEDLVIEEKFDGFKVVITKTLNNIKAYTRRGIDFSENIPYFLPNFKFLPSNTTLLGELVFLNFKGNQSLSMIQSLVNSLPKHSLNVYEVFKKEKARLIYYIYDILELRGENLMGFPLGVRKEILTKLLSKIPTSSKSPIQIVKSYPFKDYKKLLKFALSHSGEGLVIKPKNSIFKYNSLNQHEPTGEWFKYKPFETEDVILNSYKFRHKEKKAIFPAYQYKKSLSGLGFELFEVGNLSGLDRTKEKEVMERIDQGETIIAEVNYQTKFPTGKIRGMGWVRERTNEIKPRDVIFKK